MYDEADLEPDSSTPAEEPGTAQSTQGTRRGFLGLVSRKALYITPGLITLAAQQAVASGMECGSDYSRSLGYPCGMAPKNIQCCPHDWNGVAMHCDASEKVCVAD